jgi:hypothetical protein
MSEAHLGGFLQGFTGTMDGSSEALSEQTGERFGEFYIDRMADGAASEPVPRSAVPPDRCLPSSVGRRSHRRCSDRDKAGDRRARHRRTADIGIGIVKAA